MTLQHANRQLFERYDALLAAQGASAIPSVGGTDDNHLRWMCQTALAHLTDWPVDKASRWLGYVQGVLIVTRRLTTAEEREVSRPLFHAAYETMGLTAPRSVGPEK